MFGGHLGFPIGIILATFGLQFALILRTKFRVSVPENSKDIFRMAAMTAILDFQTERFSYFFIYKSTQYFLPSFESAGLSVQKKKFKMGFKDGGHGGNLRFSIGTILAILVKSHLGDIPAV